VSFEYHISKPPSIKCKSLSSIAKSTSTEKVNLKKVVVIGGGAAGVFAAIQCMERMSELDGRHEKLQVLVLEQGKELLSKVSDKKCICYDGNIFQYNILLVSDLYDAIIGID
jgi:myosin-crossreactive antigen